MTEDLYAALELDRHARPSTAEVQKAYRRMSKKTHPDLKGGSPEAFALVMLARDVLSDEARRAKYDATGEVDPTAPDTAESQAMSEAFMAIMGALSVCEQRGQVPETVDVIAAAESRIKVEITKIKGAMQQNRERAKAQRKMARRFKRKAGGESLIAALFEQNAADHERDGAKAGAGLPILERALAILGEHTFERDANTSVSPLITMVQV